MIKVKIDWDKKGLEKAIKEKIKKHEFSTKCPKCKRNVQFKIDNKTTRCPSCGQIINIKLT